MKRKVALMLSILFGNIWLCAQQAAQGNQVGTYHTLYSESLEEERQVQVYLPPGYEETDQAYPVLYVLDGQRFFLYAVSLHQSLRQFQQAPDFIVVGVTNQYPQRFALFGERKEAFAEFLGKELIPFVSQHYRTGPDRMLFGWEYGGSAAFHILSNNPDLFKAYFLASPYPIHDQIENLSGVTELENTLVFGVSPDEYEINQALDALDTLLTQSQIPGLDWKDLRFEKQEHRYTGYPVLYHGLRRFFQYYPELEVNNLGKFLEAGGMEYARDYARERADRHGFQPELSLWSRFTIVRSAMRAADYPQFVELLNAVGANAFAAELIAGGRAYTAFDIAGYHQANRAFQSAMEIYTMLLKDNSESKQLFNRLAECHAALGNKREAQKFLELGQQQP